MARRNPRPPVDPTDEEAAWAAALRRLSRQPMPRALLEQRLGRLGYEAATVARTLDRAAQLGYLDDQAYADSLVRRRRTTRGRSLIARELRAKGIGDADVARALGQVDPDAEETQALALARSTLRQRPAGTNEGWGRRVGAVLGRRGFRPATIVRVMRQLRDESALTGIPDDLVEPD